MAMKYPWVAALLLCLATFTQATARLIPSEVLVVANEASPDSVKLARTYVKLRGIPQANLALIRTTAGYKVSREGYDSQIAGPIRKLLTDRRLKDRIRSIVLMWGVPVRVMGPAVAALTPRQLLYKRTAEKAHYRAIIAYKFLGSVGEQFPTPRTKSFKPTGALFDMQVTAPAPPLPKFDELRKDIERLFAQKRARIADIPQADKRRIAWRQLMALELDLRGLRGLKEFIRVNRPPASAGAPDVSSIDTILFAATAKLGKLEKGPDTNENITARVDMINNISGAFGVYDRAQRKSPAAAGPVKKRGFLDRTLNASDASVDSELAALLWPDHRLAGWLDNPMCVKLRVKPALRNRRVLMTARIDGPTAADAMKIITTSIEVERKGLKGNFYIDAGGGPSPAYNKNLRRLYDLAKANTRLNIIFDDQPQVFQPGTCDNAALYVGWYSLKKYVPAFSWVPGAVGWHIASYEAMDLRNPASQTWCVKMIQNGVVATIGAVAEPLLGSFPMPQDFFGYLLTGKYTLAECYWATIPSVSWRVTLIGDPLYNPFAADPQLTPASSP